MATITISENDLLNLIVSVVDRNKYNFDGEDSLASYVFADGLIKAIKESKYAIVDETQNDENSW
jgi:hypothetical protein